QQVQWQIRRTPGRSGPGELLVHGVLELVHLSWVPGQHVQAGVEAVHPMDEQAEVNGWIPWQGVPRHGPPEHLQLGMWHDPLEHLVERVSRDRGLPVAGEEASPLMDDAASERSGL